MRIFAILILLALPISVFGQQPHGPSSGGPFEFRGLQFGQPPVETMLCTRGDCGFGTRSIGGNARQRILTSYKFPIDITQLGGVQIEAPEYDFFQDQLARIRFPLLCEEEAIPACLEAVAKAFEASYPVVLLDHGREEDSPGPEEWYVYSSAPSVIIEIIDPPTQRVGKEPFVRISDHDLMERVRLEANPNYQRRPFPGR